MHKCSEYSYPYFFVLIGLLVFLLPTRVNSQSIKAKRQPPQIRIITQPRLVLPVLYTSHKGDLWKIHGQILGDQKEMISQAGIRVKCFDQDQKSHLTAFQQSTFSGEFTLTLPQKCITPSLISKWKKGHSIVFTFEIQATPISSKTILKKACAPHQQSAQIKIEHLEQIFSVPKDRFKEEISFESMRSFKMKINLHLDQNLLQDQLQLKVSPCISNPPFSVFQAKVNLNQFIHITLPPVPRGCYLFSLTSLNQEWIYIPPLSKKVIIQDPLYIYLDTLSKVQSQNFDITGVIHLPILKQKEVLNLVLQSETQESQSDSPTRKAPHLGLHFLSSKKLDLQPTATPRYLPIRLPVYFDPLHSNVRLEITSKTNNPTLHPFPIQTSWMRIEPHPLRFKGWWLFILISMISIMLWIQNLKKTVFQVDSSPLSQKSMNPMTLHWDENKSQSAVPHSLMPLKITLYNALTHQPLTGDLYFVQPPPTLGSTWSIYTQSPPLESQILSFKSPSSHSPSTKTPLWEGSNQFMDPVWIWATAEGFEPSVASILPQQTGHLKLPLWPFRYALIRQIYIQFPHLSHFPSLLTQHPLITSSFSSSISILQESLNLDIELIEELEERLYGTLPLEFEHFLDLSLKICRHQSQFLFPQGDIRTQWSAVSIHPHPLTSPSPKSVSTDDS